MYTIIDAKKKTPLVTAGLSEGVYGAHLNHLKAKVKKFISSKN